jgi:hypothetical protein
VSRVTSACEKPSRVEFFDSASAWCKGSAGRSQGRLRFSTTIEKGMDEMKSPPQNHGGDEFAESQGLTANSY